MKFVKLSLVACILPLLSGCKLVLLDPAGDVAAQQGDLIIYATVLMLIVILPVIALTIFFAFHYRASNKNAVYQPEWDHSISLEIVVWSVPLAIIICLAGLTWVATHRLNPYDDLKRISEDQEIVQGLEPMQVQVVAMDWKWLFIYPEYGIASVNEMAAIVDHPVEFKLTSDTVMNSFYIPDMAGMIYTMAGMETELNAVINENGVFPGFSANYSGNGFSHMHFNMHAVDKQGFADWVVKIKSGENTLDRRNYLELAKPSVKHPVTYYSDIEAGLWERILNLCVEEGKLCQHDMMMVDSLGGGGLEGLINRQIYAGICSVDDVQSYYYLLRPEMREKMDAYFASLDTKATLFTPAAN